MFDFFTILHDNGLLLLMGQYPDGPLGGVLCTLLVSLLAVALVAGPIRLVLGGATGTALIRVLKLTGLGELAAAALLFVGLWLGR